MNDRSPQLHAKTADKIEVKVVQRPDFFRTSELQLAMLIPEDLDPLVVVEVVKDALERLNAERRKPWTRS